MNLVRSPKKLHIAALMSRNDEHRIVEDIPDHVLIWRTTIVTGNQTACLGRVTTGLNQETCNVVSMDPGSLDQDPPTT